MFEPPISGIFANLVQHFPAIYGPPIPKDFTDPSWHFPGIFEPSIPGTCTDPSQCFPATFESSISRVFTNRSKHFPATLSQQSQVFLLTLRSIFIQRFPAVFAPPIPGVFTTPSVAELQEVCIFGDISEQRALVFRITGCQKNGLLEWNIFLTDGAYKFWAMGTISSPLHVQTQFVI